MNQTQQAQRAQRVVMVSNRLPISVEKVGPQWRARPSSGGLVTALAPVMRDRGGVWIGWPGTEEQVDLNRLLKAESRPAYDVKPVWLSSEERDKFYLGFSNAVLWPLFHALHTNCDFNPEFWTAYRWVNQKYARVVKHNVIPGDFVWVHDYHLMLLAQELRLAKVEQTLGFFLHIPFPAPDIYLKLPWRREIIDALLNYDLIGFQTLRNRRNFIQCVRALVDDVDVKGKGNVHTLRVGRRTLRVGYFPISIDYDEFSGTAATEEVGEMAWQMRQQLPNRQLVLGVDRLDYTKGIPNRLLAFRRAIETYPELRERLSLIQVVVPSRSDIAPYHELKTEIDRLVGEINGAETASGWVPIHYIFRHLDRTELLALYRTADIGLITPLEDGMNLVAKEFCASSVEENSVLILSEFAGAATQLRGATLVNPYDIKSVGAALHEAFNMPAEERRARMRQIRNSVREHNISRWLQSYLVASEATPQR